MAASKCPTVSRQCSPAEGYSRCTDRAARVLKPKLRPGSALLKWSFKCALRAPAPQDAAMEHI